MISWSFFEDDKTLGYGSLIDEAAYLNAMRQGFFFKFWWFRYYVTITDYWCSQSLIERVFKALKLGLNLLESSESNKL